jgi:hypothetical protein
MMMTCKAMACPLTYPQMYTTAEGIWMQHPQRPPHWMSAHSPPQQPHRTVHPNGLACLNQAPPWFNNRRNCRRRNPLLKVRGEYLRRHRRQALWHAQCVMAQSRRSSSTTISTCAWSVHSRRRSRPMNMVMCMQRLRPRSHRQPQPVDSL